jgi:peptidoglycan/LPS O-acetylase OafA/YrhL
MQEPAMADPQRALELPGLTPLRGIAALAVVLYHGSCVAFAYAGGAPASIWARGYLAVDLFFFLSGFVLTHVHGRRLAADRTWPAVGRFLWARFCRIYPAALFTTAIFVFQYATGRLTFPLNLSFKAQLIAALMLMQVPWLDDIAINGPSWSISAEWYAYLLFPFIAPLICRLKRHSAAVLGVTLLIGIAVDHMVVSPEQQIRGWQALIRALPEFAAGVFAYRFYTERYFHGIWEKDATFIVIAAIIIAACLAGVSDGLTVILLLALLLAAVCNSGRMTGVLNARPLRWLGEVSYSVYIFQMLPFMVAATLAGTLVAHGLGGFRFEMIAALLVISSGVLVHRCVDVPARAWLRRLPHLITVVPAADRAEIRAMPLTSAAVPERDQ